MSILVENREIRGAMDACVGAMGIIHGPLDLEMIRDIDDGKRTANECFSRAGAVKVAGVDTKVARAKEEIIRMYLEGSREAELAIQTMVMTIIMEIWGLKGIAERIDGIVLTGSIGSMQKPVNIFQMIKEGVEDIAPVSMIPPTSGSVGSAQIAKAVFTGEKDILGIKVI